jgi:hypothetical protein
MTRQPHVSRGPYLPPEEPERESLAVALLGLAALIALFVVLFVIVPVLG